jgi:signal peptidase I
VTENSPGTRAPRKRDAKGGRESIESFVVVFLGFLLWSFEAEGFVIPTGSMAPTLMGRHKEIACPQCGYVYTVDAEREVDLSGRATGPGRRIASGTCENCRFECAVADAPSFSGDRVYVMKDGVSLPFLASAGKVELKRWDVAVFKLPEEPEVRYIKRLVGMPNEVLRIQGGDLWASPGPQPGVFERLRRPLVHQQAMQMMVYDDSNRAVALERDPRWRRWSAHQPETWIEPNPGAYVARSRPGEWAELRYRHVVPTPEQWGAIRAGAALPSPPRTMLITDYASYNTDLAADDREYPRLAARPWFQPHWVGDLTISCRVTTRRPAGHLRLELIKSALSNRCEIDLETGAAALLHDQTALGPSIRTPLNQPGTYDLIFANVDGRLTLWVDGHLPFGEGRTYQSDPTSLDPTAADLEPARIAAKAADLQVDKIVLRRDVYYTLDPAEPDFTNLGGAQVEAAALYELLSDPTRFRTLVARPPRDYPIRPGHYFMLGDNSPWSRDARAWGSGDQLDPDIPGRGWDNPGRASWEVPEQLLVGKAFCVYWPHPKPVWPRFKLGNDIHLPSLPYIERMRWIR